MKFIIIVSLFLTSRLVCMDELESVIIERQLRNDTVYLKNLLCQSDVTLCNVDDKVTYLVDDKECVSNQELLSGCVFALSPNGVQNFSSLAVYLKQNDPQQQDNKLTLLSDDVNSSSMMSRSVAMITRRDYEYYDVEDGFLDCQVESLEVYRGRQQATKISHGGFSISENGSIEIDQHTIAYNIDEFKGELFRMSLTCSDDISDELERGCLFFKIIGMSNVTKVKFGGTVSGTNQRPNVKDNTDSLASPSRYTLIDVVMYSVSAVAGFLLLLLIVVLVCCCCCCTKAEKTKKRKDQATSVNIPSKLKCELDLSYLAAASQEWNKATDHRPQFSTDYFKLAKLS